MGKSGGAEDKTRGEEWRSLGSNQWGRVEELRIKPWGSQEMKIEPMGKTGGAEDQTSGEYCRS